MPQIAEVTPNTKPGAPGFILPTATALGNPSENTLLTQTATELIDLGLSPREVFLDGGFIPPRPTTPSPKTSTSPAANRTDRGAPKAGQQKYRTGAEGRISHLKRSYGLKCSRLKGAQGQQISNAWGILAHNLDTYTHLA